MALGDAEGAFTALQPLVGASTPSMPAALLGYALADAASLAEQLGQRARAIEFYTRAAELFGVDARTRTSAERALARLRASRPPI
jgi:hypothetical protein